MRLTREKIIAWMFRSGWRFESGNFIFSDYGDVVYDQVYDQNQEKLLSEMEDDNTEALLESLANVYHVGTNQVVEAIQSGVRCDRMEYMQDMYMTTWEMASVIVAAMPSIVAQLIGKVESEDDAKLRIAEFFTWRMNGQKISRNGFDFIVRLWLMTAKQEYEKIYGAEQHEKDDAENKPKDFHAYYQAAEWLCSELGGMTGKNKNQYASTSLQLAMSNDKRRRGYSFEMTKEDIARHFAQRIPIITNTGRPRRDYSAKKQREWDSQREEAREFFLTLPALCKKWLDENTVEAAK